MELKPPDKLIRAQNKRENMKKPRKPVRWVQCDHIASDERYNIKKLIKD